MRTRPRVWGGLLLIVIGILFLLENAGFWRFGDLVREFWPVLLILWGLLILFRYRSPRGPEGANAVSSSILGPEKGEATQDLLNITNVFGEVEMLVSSKNFRGGNVSTVFGHIVLDCSRAVLAGGENYLTVSGVFGDLRVQMPKGAAFAVSTNTLFGTVLVNNDRRSGIAPSMVYETPDYQTATSRLRLRLSQVFGEVEVRQ